MKHTRLKTGNPTWKEKGSNALRPPVTEDERQEIKRLFATGILQSEIARKVKRSECTVSKIVKGGPVKDLAKIEVGEGFFDVDMEYKNCSTI